MTTEEQAAAKTAAEAKKAAAKTAAEAKVDVVQAAKSHRQLTKEYLDKQEKVSVLLQLSTGEPIEETVTINDVKFVIPRGKRVSVPLDVATMIEDKMRAEGKLAQVSKEMMANMAKSENPDNQ